MVLVVRHRDSIGMLKDQRIWILLARRAVMLGDQTGIEGVVDVEEVVCVVEMVDLMLSGLKN